VTEIVVVEPPAGRTGRQDVPIRSGVSRASAGAQGISLNVTEFPPGGHTNAHLHRGFETAIYAVEGAVVLFYGEGLERSAVLREGSFCYIPPGLPHKAYNLSEEHPARFVSARNDADEPENVVPLPDADEASTDERARELRRSYAAGDL
jgi:uncharacterized RmlC-like cupin family protein